MVDENSAQILKEIGTVVELDNEYAYVKTQRSTGCSGCHSESGCGTSALSKLFTKTNPPPLKVRRNMACHVGDQVELALDESRLLKHSFMAYGIPLIGLFLLSIIGDNIADHLFNAGEQMIEMTAILMGLFGVYLGWKYTQYFYTPILPEINSVLKKQTENL